jgi:hypothetical protein
MRFFRATACLNRSWAVSLYFSASTRYCSSAGLSRDCTGCKECKWRETHRTQGAQGVSTGQTDTHARACVNGSDDTHTRAPAPQWQAGWWVLGPVMSTSTVGLSTASKGDKTSHEGSLFAAAGPWFDQLGGARCGRTPVTRCRRGGWGSSARVKSNGLGLWV